MSNTKEKKQIIFDIETTGLNPWYGDKITCICAIEGEYKDKLNICSRNEVKILLEFLSFLKKYDVANTVLITANGTEFDIPFICSRIAQNLEILHKFKSPYEITEYEQFDILTDIAVSSRHRMSLNAMAQIYGYSSKTGNGLQAIEWFKEDNFKMIKDYCMHDVLLTKQIFDKYASILIKNGFYPNYKKR